MKQTPPANLLSRKIRQARLEADLSQKELSQTLSLSDRTISAYEQGRAVPPVTTLRAISSATRKPISYFLDEQLPTTQDVALEIKIKQIELELLAIKQTLQRHGLL